jgi:hypothetical protein
MRYSRPSLNPPASCMYRRAVRTSATFKIAMTSLGVRSSSRADQALCDTRSAEETLLGAEPSAWADLLDESLERMPFVAAVRAALTSPPAVPRIHSDS